MPGSDVYWTHERERLVNTAIALPGGTVVRKRNGITSGDPGTSIVGSWCCWLILKSILPDAEIYSFGDDAVIVFKPGTTTPSLDSISEEAMHMFGVKIHPQKSYYTSRFTFTGSEPREKATASFLSLYWDRYFNPAPLTHDIIQHLYHPEINRDSVTWEMVRAAALYMTSYKNFRASDICSGYFHYLSYYIPTRIPRFWEIFRFTGFLGLKPVDMYFPLLRRLPPEEFLTALYNPGPEEEYHPP
jgi:hypothetical protein